MTGTHQQLISNLGELQSLAKKLSLSIQPPQIVVLKGTLGVGKTQIVRFMGENLGIPKKDICSPSFSLINIYKSSLGSVTHMDLFRLKNIEDLESTGVGDVVLESQILFIEWSDELENPFLVRSFLGEFVNNIHNLSWNVLCISLKFTQNTYERDITWSDQAAKDFLSLSLK